jgi:hypothetical protein
MQVFETDKKEIRVLSRQLNQTGVLFLATRVEIRGNHLKGKVPVKIVYRTRFTPDEEFWKKDDEYPDEEPYSVTYPNEFLVESERAEHCKNWYEVLPQEAA